MRILSERGLDAQLQSTKWLTFVLAESRCARQPNRGGGWHSRPFFASILAVARQQGRCRRYRSAAEVRSGARHHRLSWCVLLMADGRTRRRRGGLWAKLLPDHWQSWIQRTRAGGESELLGRSVPVPHRQMAAVAANEVGQKRKFSDLRDKSSIEL